MNFLHKLMGFYAQDQWKARTNLTLTLGLRYDIDFFPSASEAVIYVMMGLVLLLRPRGLFGEEGRQQ